MALIVVLKYPSLCCNALVYDYCLQEFQLYDSLFECQTEFSIRNVNTDVIFSIPESGIHVSENIYSNFLNCRAETPSHVSRSYQPIESRVVAWCEYKQQIWQ